MNFDVVRKVLAAFESKEVEYVVFGAAAINLLGLARATEDLDVFISATAENVERLKAALKNVFDDPAIAMLRNEEVHGEAQGLGRCRGAAAAIPAGRELMPWRKFRSLQEMEDSLWYAPGDPGLAEAIRRVWDFAARTVPRRFPPGVHRHRSIEDAQALRDQWEEADFREFWARKRRAQTP